MLPVDKQCRISGARGTPVNVTMRSSFLKTNTIDKKHSYTFNKYLFSYWLQAKRTQVSTYTIQTPTPWYSHDIFNFI